MDSIDETVRITRGSLAPGVVVSRIVAAGWEPPADLPPHHIAGPPIGRGGMGDVFEARDPHLLREVALKVLRDGSSESAVARFMTEALVTAQLEHPAIPPVYRLERTEDGRLAFAMRLVRGRTLEEILRESTEARKAGGRVPETLRLGTLIEYFLKVCDAVGHAHERDVLHRDLKPRNIMVGQAGELYVLDWGLAKAPEGVVHSELAQLTATGQVLGSPRYMAPEQAVGEPGRVGPAVDQYALGLLLYRMLTGRQVRAKRSKWMALQAALDGESVGTLEPPHPDELPWPEMYAIVRRATEPDPEARFESVRDLASAVRAARDRPPRPPEQPRNALVGFVERHLDAFVYLGLAGLAVGSLAFAVLVVTGVLGVEVYEHRLADREARLAELVGQVGERATRLDRDMARLESELVRIASKAETLHLLSDPEDRPFFAPQTFGKPDGPSDVVFSPVYDRDISTTQADVALAPGIALTDVEREIQVMLPLMQTLRQAQVNVRSGWGQTPEDAAVRAWVEEPGPMRWAMYATESGFSMNMPGGFWDPTGFDHRERPWYRLGERERRPTWGRAFQEVMTGRLMIPCSVEVGPPEAPIGVATITVAFDYLTRKHLVAEDPAVREAFLLDRHGRVLMRSSEADLLGRTTELDEAWRAPMYAHAARLGALDHAGVVELGDLLVVHSPLAHTGWSVVLEVEGDALQR